MEWSGKWDWDNLVMFNSKASESLKKLQLTDWEIEDGGEIDAAAVSFNLSGSGGSCSDLAHGSSLKSSISASTNSSTREEEEGINNKTNSGFTFERTSGSAVIKKRQQHRAELSGTSSPLEGSVVSVEPLICLKLGKRTYFENNSSSPTNNNNAAKSLSSSSVVVVVPESSSSSSSVANVKKTKSAASQNVTSIPLCQVEGCNLDLSSAKEYHKKHRVCDDHSKCPKVIVGGLERRFCQQCSRFHSLSEFDEKKRSCRRRLSDHNARRRKPRQETIQFHSAKLSSSSSSSSFYDGRQQMNFALNNGKGIGNYSTKWGEDMLYSSSKFTITKDFPFNAGKGSGGRQPSVPPPIELPFAISPLHSSSNSTCKTTTTSTDLFMQGCGSSTKETMFSNSEQEQLPPRALSLLSTNSSWVSSDEPTDSISFDQHLHLNPTTTMMILPSITQGGGLPLIGSSDYWQQIEQQQQQHQHHSFINPQFHYFNSSSSNNNSNSGVGGGGQEIQLLKPQHYHGIYIPMS